MDVVPYVTEVWTSLSEYDRNNTSVYARSSVGNYPVRVDETVTVYGWNLNYTTRSVKLNETTVSGTSVSANTNDDVEQGTYGIKVPITSSMKSGSLEVSVNGITAINNINNNDAKGNYTGDISDKDATGKEYAHGYNRQPNGINNNVLTDDIALDVWDFKVAAQPEGSSAKYVHMKVGPYIPGDANNARIGFSFKNGIGYYNMAGNACDVAGGIKLMIPTSYSSRDYLYIYGCGEVLGDWPGAKISELEQEGSYYIVEIAGVSSLSYIFNDDTSQDATGTISKSGIYKSSGSTFTWEGDITSNVSATTVFSHTRMGSNFGGFTSNTFTFDS